MRSASKSVIARSRLSVPSKRGGLAMRASSVAAAAWAGLSRDQNRASTQSSQSSAIVVYCRPLWKTSSHRLDDQ
jgi:hypothetical protein